MINEFYFFKSKREILIKKYDEINNPRHYTKYYLLEPIEVIEKTGMSYNLGQIFKYLVRSPYKDNELKDLKKARYYTNWLKEDEVEKFINNSNSNKLIMSFYEKSLNKEFLSPIIFKDAFTSNNPKIFIHSLKEMIDQRIQNLS